MNAADRAHEIARHEALDAGRPTPRQAHLDRIAAMDSQELDSNPREVTARRHAMLLDVEAFDRTHRAAS